MRTFPFTQQLDTMDCGPACLSMVSKWYGKDFSLQDLRDKCHINRNGVNMLGISYAAGSIGLKASGVRISFKEMVERVKLPCIVYWGQKHFVVVYKIKKSKCNTKVYVADPSSQKLVFNGEEFCRMWICTRKEGVEKGIALTLEPTPYFYEITHGSKPKLDSKFLFKYLKPYKGLIWQLLLGLLLSSLIQLIIPFSTQAIVDRGIGKRDINLIYLILFAQLFLVIGRASIEFVRRWILLHIGTRINVSVISDFLTKLMRLPIAFFDTKRTGDLLQRIGDHERIERFLTDSVLNLLFSFFSLIIFSIVLLLYNVKVILIFIVGSILYISWIYIFMSKRKELDNKNFAQMSANQSNLMQLIMGMQEIKLTGSMEQKKWEWSSIQAELFDIKIKSLTLGQWQQGGAVLLNEIKNIIITILSSTLVISGEITIGAMLSIQFIMGQLQGPIEQLVSFLQDSQNAYLSIQRLNEIQEQEEEEEEEDSFEGKVIYHIPVKGILEFSNVDFSYIGYQKEAIFKKVTFQILPGKITAIVGNSGCGKTTLLKLLLGFYKPLNGCIKLDGIRLDRYSMKEWRSSIGVVMQDGYIFNDSIAHNIAPADDIIDSKRLIEAAQMSNIHEFICELPAKYNTKIGNEGQSISNGQKQRILLARAIYKNPHYLFFDEATNSLDANNEKEIITNLQSFFDGKTVIIIAHRLSTIKNADQILVLDKGEIAEFGNHNKLIERRGLYYQLFKNQMDDINNTNTSWDRKINITKLIK